jgi:Galactose oxidase, central domain/Kelch motif
VPTLVADPVGARLVLYGGWESAPNIYHRDAWILDGLDATPTWWRVEPASERPQARFFHVAGYDPAARAMVAFGGGANGSAYKDAVALTLPTDRRRAEWHSIALTVQLTARDQATVVLDDGMLTVFGGFGAGTMPGSITAGTHLADTWQRAVDRRGGWRLATPVNTGRVPLAREGTAYALDAEQHRLFLFGGLNGDTTLADVWVADITRPGRPRWQQVCSPTSCGDGPAARWGAHAVYDAAGQRLVVFGGLAGGGVAVDDVWTLELTGAPVWSELHPDGPTPGPRWSAAYGFDPAGRRLVVFGGQTGPDASGTPLGDTWALSLDAAPRWTLLATTGIAPPARRSPAGAIRTGDGRVELVVAMGYVPVTGLHHGDVWSLDLTADDATWAPATHRHGARPPVCTTPPPTASCSHSAATRPRSPTTCGPSTSLRTPGQPCPDDLTRIHPQRSTTEATALLRVLIRRDVRTPARAEARGEAVASA